MSGPEANSLACRIRQDADISQVGVICKDSSMRGSCTDTIAAMCSNDGLIRLITSGPLFLVHRSVNGDIAADEAGPLEVAVQSFVPACWIGIGRVRTSSDVGVAI